MGFSLLKACGLDVLVTEKIEDYIDLAIQIGAHQSLQDSLQATLEKNLKTSPLFNSERTVRLIENGYQETIQIYLNGENPRHIDVKPIE